MWGETSLQVAGREVREQMGARPLGKERVLRVIIWKSLSCDMVEMGRVVGPGKVNNYNQ